MFQDLNFKYCVSVSVDGYPSKQEAQACLSRTGARAVGRQKMAFRRQQLTAAELIGRATSGHAFCGLFDYDANQKYWTQCGEHRQQSYPEYKRGSNAGAMKLTFKSDQFCSGAQLVFVDIDATRYTDLTAYTERLQWKPTCLYTSFSDTPERRKFRMVYGLSRPLGVDELRRASATIHRLVAEWTGEPISDLCGTRPSQYMNGTRTDAVTYVSGWVYEPDDLAAVAEQAAATPSVAAEKASVAAEKASVSEEMASVSTATPTFDPLLVHDMETLTYDRLMHYYSRQYRYFYRTELDTWTDDLYQLTTDDYLQLWHYTQRVPDGNHRRRRLFKNVCLRRLMQPHADADTLLFNLYVDRERYFDNSDGVLTIDCLKRKVLTALQMSHEELADYCAADIAYWRSHRPEFIVPPGTPRSEGLPQRISKQLRMQKWMSWYDPAKSVRENMAQARRFGVSQRTVYRYLKGE